MRYEFRHLKVDVTELEAPSFMERLAEYGREGFQLATTISHEKHGYSHAVHLIFSRFVPDEPSQRRTP